MGVKIGAWVRVLLWVRRVKRSAAKMGAMQSKTTQNVAVAATPAGALLTLLAVVRGISPGLMPWPSEVDAAICALLGTVIMAAPIVSRKIALWRDPGKAEKKALFDVVVETVTEVPPEAVVEAGKAARVVGEFLTRKDRPPREAAEVRRAKFVAFAERLKVEAEKARAERVGG